VYVVEEVKVVEEVEGGGWNIEGAGKKCLLCCFYRKLTGS